MLRQMEQQWEREPHSRQPFAPGMHKIPNCEQPLIEQWATRTSASRCRATAIEPTPSNVQLEMLPSEPGQHVMAFMLSTAGQKLQP